MTKPAPTPDPSFPPRPGAAPARLLVCDDQALFRLLIRDALRNLRWIEIIGEATSGSDAVDLALELKPDLVLMDVNIPSLGGIEATRQILAQAPATRVVAFSASSGPATIKKMFDAGAAGYVYKLAVPSDLVEGLQKVLAGERFMSSQLALRGPQDLD